MEAIAPTSVQMRQIMTGPAVEAGDDATLREVASLLAEQSVGAAVIRGAEGPVGMVTEHDIVAAVADGTDLDTALAGDVMAEDLAFVTPEDSLEDAVRIMSRHWIRHLPVVADDGDVVGVVSARDVLLTLSEE